ncbi:MAG: glycerophosphodiester phosphodiesterase family protein [Bacteroidaceae bacterium]|nr:glycerophosphodiester phosphodiesterase family protein [Bacteroidaceae bacterium]
MINKMCYLILLLLALLLVAMSLSACSNVIFGKRGYSRQQIDNLIIVAHRGASGNGAPENSLAAIRESLQLGVDMIEVDVRLTKDGELVVCHDAKIDRTTNGKGSVTDMTLDELRNSRIIDKNGIPTNETLPTLGEVLELVDGKCTLLIDVKRGSNPEQIAKALINEVALYGAASWVAVQSFDDEVLEHLHRLGHPFPLEKLFVFKIPFLPFAYDGKLVGYGYSKYDYISSFNFHYAMLPNALINRIHAWGKKVKVWTLGAPSDALYMPVDGVITDCPELWNKQ